MSYSGGFVYQDMTGVCPPEMVYFEPAPDSEWDKMGDETPVSVYRLRLDPPRFKTLTEEGKRRGLATAALLPKDRNTLWFWYSEWFVSKLDEVATYTGTTRFQLLRGLFSKNPVTRARVYHDLIATFGVEEFDSYPLEMTETEARTRYSAELKAAHRA